MAVGAWQADTIRPYNKQEAMRESRLETVGSPYMVTTYKKSPKSQALGGFTITNIITV